MANLALASYQRRMGELMGAERPGRELLAVMFTDLVASTTAVAEGGDAAWRSRLDGYESRIRRSVEQHHGTVIKHLGDGTLATFPSGSQALSAAVAAHAAIHELGLVARTGVHVGEVEIRGDDVGGIAVHLASRVMDAARPQEILVTPTVVQSSLGAGQAFVPRGRHELKGIDGIWDLSALDHQIAH